MIHSERLTCLSANCTPVARKTKALQHFLTFLLEKIIANLN